LAPLLGGSQGGYGNGPKLSKLEIHKTRENIDLAGLIRWALKGAAMTIAFLSFFGVVVGASLQYFFTRHLDNQKHLRGLRTQAYTDYLRSVCEQAMLVIQPQSKESREIFANTADAKSRICLYGSKEAVVTFAEFERLGAQMKTNEQRKAFSRMVSVMRKDSGGRDDASIENLEIVLLGHHK
jgi:hypothetical protein